MSRRAPRVEGLGPAVVLCYGAPQAGTTTIAYSAAAGARGRIMVVDGSAPDFEEKLEVAQGIAGVEVILVDGRPLHAEDLQHLVDRGLIDASRGSLCRVLRGGKSFKEGQAIERMANVHSLIQTSVTNEDAFDAACQLYIFADPSR